jgi:hypothetical protein
MGPSNRYHQLHDVAHRARLHVGKADVLMASNTSGRLESKADARIGHAVSDVALFGHTSFNQICQFLFFLARSFTFSFTSLGFFSGG